MAPKVDYTKQYRDAVNHTVSRWEEQWMDIYGPNKNDCILFIQIKANQILQEINKLQLKMGESAPYDLSAADWTHSIYLLKCALAQNMNFQKIPVQQLKTWRDKS
jgi:hypothetical protein